MFEKGTFYAERITEATEAIESYRRTNEEIDTDDIEYDGNASKNKNKCVTHS